jgi:hypothetical protein
VTRVGRTATGCRFGRRHGAGRRWPRSRRWRCARRRCAACASRRRGGIFLGDHPYCRGPRRLCRRQDRVRRDWHTRSGRRLRQRCTKRH